NLTKNQNDKQTDPAVAEHLSINLGPILWTVPLLIVGLLVLRSLNQKDIALKLDDVGGAASLHACTEFEKG
ncbi:MAG TPA: hypothetical protein PLA50_13180, partial [Bacteroidia bacterium]|nr:hypothetical protein [Bacteroidia bacterium]